MKKVGARKLKGTFVVAEKHIRILNLLNDQHHSNPYFTAESFIADLYVPGSE